MTAPPTPRTQRSANTRPKKIRVKRTDPAHPLYRDTGPTVGSQQYPVGHVGGVNSPEKRRAAAQIVQLREQLADKRRDLYFNDPVAWARDRLGIHLWSKQAEVAKLLVTDKRTAVQSAHATGKMTSPDEMIPTPEGWSRAGDLRVGQEVLDEQGRPTRIVGTSPEWTLEFYRVHFAGGGSVEVAGEHEWSVMDLCHRRKGRISDWRDHWDRSMTVETRHMLDEGLRTGNGQLRWRIPVAGALELPEVGLPIDPYVLGVWLGDGSAANSQVSIGSTKHGIIDMLRDAGEEVSVRDLPTQDGSVLGVRGLKVRLRSLGVLGHKHIPPAYLRASQAQREALLAGLMDTDGFMVGVSGVGIDLTDKQLAHDVHELVTTLGCKVNIREGVAAYTKNDQRRITGTRYRMNWRPLDDPFRARGGVWQDTGNMRSSSTQRTIERIEPIGEQTGFCIQVESERGLYLAGEDMVPTHNSFLASVLACWWIDTRPPGEAMVVTTAPSYEQVHSILWEEIRKRHVEGGLAGIVHRSDRWLDNQGRLVGFGRRPPDHSKSAFQGHHKRFVLVLVDEGSGIPAWIWNAVEAITTSDECRILAIGNPDDNSSTFAKICQTDKGWRNVKISAFDSPNLTGERVPYELSKVLVTANWVESRRINWGETNPMYRAKILGEFADNEEGLIPLSWIKQAVARHTLWEEAGRPNIPAKRIIGVDVARFGLDHTAIAVREGDVIRDLYYHAKLDTTQTTSLVSAQLDYPDSLAVVDVIGVGAGVVDQLRANRRSVEAFNASAATKRRDATGSWRFRNTRHAAWWNVRELLDPAMNARGGPAYPGALSVVGPTLAIPNDDDLVADLAAPTWDLGTGNTIVVEDKDSIKKKTGRSPDGGDAVVQSLWVQSPRTVVRPVVRKHRDAIKW